MHSSPQSGVTNVNIMSTSHAHPGWGWFCIILGLYPIAIATELWPVDATAVHVPIWVVFLCGVVFLMGGAMILIDRDSKFNAVCAAILLMGMGAVGAWVTVLGPPAGFSGGMPFLPGEYNVIFARWVFGCGALVSFMISAYAIRALLKPRAQRIAPGD